MTRRNIVSPVGGGGLRCGVTVAGEVRPFVVRTAGRAPRTRGFRTKRRRVTRPRRVHGRPTTVRRWRVRPPTATNGFRSRGVRRIIVRDIRTTRLRNVTRTRRLGARVRGGGRPTFRRWRSAGPVFGRYRTRRPIVRRVARGRMTRNRRSVVRRRRWRPKLGRNARTSGGHATFGRCAAATVSGIHSVAGVVVVFAEFRVRESRENSAIRYDRTVLVENLIPRRQRDQDISSGPSRSDDK